MSLPLQPGPPRPRWLTAIFPALLVIVGLGGLGALGLIRRQPVEIVLTGPGHTGDYSRIAERLLATAKKRIRVQQYVVRPDDDGPVAALFAGLVAAQARGVDVRVALDKGRLYGTNAPDPKNDDAAAWLKAHNIRVEWDEVSRTSHAKILFVDDHIALVGSHNWTRAALLDNREVSVVLTEPAQLAPIRELIESIPGMAEDVAVPVAVSSAQP